MPSIEPSILNAALEISEVVGQSVEAKGFRAVHDQLGALGEPIGYGMGSLNYPQPRVLGDISTFMIWERVRAHPSLPATPTHPYMKALADAFVPLLSVQAVACQFPDIYYPPLLINERLNDPFSPFMPVGVELFLDQQAYSGVLWTRLPRTFRAYLPEQLLQVASPGTWHSYRDTLPRVYSRGGQLRSVLQKLLRALSESSAAQVAQEAARSVLGDPSAKAELARAIVQFHSDVRAKQSLDRMTLGERAKFEAEFVQRVYSESSRASVRDYFGSVRAFERQVILVCDFVAQATMRWPFLDISSSKIGPVSLTRQDGMYLTTIYLAGDKLFALMDLLDRVVRFGAGPYPAQGLHLVRQATINWQDDDWTSFGAYVLEWLGSG